MDPGGRRPALGNRLARRELAQQRGAVGEGQLDERLGPEEAQPVGQNEANHAGDHQQADAEPGARKPDRRVASSKDFSERHQSALYRSRKRCRTSSATVFTVKVKTKSRAEARKSTRYSVPPSGASGISTATFADKRAKAVEDRPVHDRRIAGRHQHDHRLADGAAEAHHDRREDARTCSRQHHPHGGLPPARPAGERGSDQVRRHASEGVFANGEDDRDDRKPHRHAHDEAVALVVGEAERGRQPLARVAAEQPDLDERRDRKRHPAADEEHRQDDQQLCAHLDATPQRAWQDVPDEKPRRAEQRKHDAEQHHADEVALDDSGQIQAGDEANHDARQRRHDLDGRFDAGAQRRMHELRGVERPQDTERNRKEERVERPLDRAEHQRSQTDLRLEIVGRRGRLPDVLGLGVALVPDLPEQGMETRLRMGIRQRERDRFRRPPWRRTGRRSWESSPDPAPRVVPGIVASVRPDV